MNSSSKDSTIEKKLGINQKVYKAFETGDRAVLDSFIAKDAVDHAGPNGTTISGDSVINMLVDMHNHVKDFKIDIIKPPQTAIISLPIQRQRELLLTLHGECP